MTIKNSIKNISTTLFQNNTKAQMPEETYTRTMNPPTVQNIQPTISNVLEPIDFDIEIGYSNIHKQRMAVKTDCDELVFTIFEEEGNKSASFRVSYKNRMLIQNLKTMISNCETHASRRRIENEKTNMNFGGEN